MFFTFGKIMIMKYTMKIICIIYLLLVIAVVINTKSEYTFIIHKLKLIQITAVQIKHPYIFNVHQHLLDKIHN